MIISIIITLAINLITNTVAVMSSSFVVVIGFDDTCNVVTISTATTTAMVSLQRC